MAEEWTLGQGFGQTKAKDLETDGQQAGETPFHGEALVASKGPGWTQSATPGSTASRGGRKVGVMRNVNGYGGGIKSKRYDDGQAISGALNRNTGHGDPTAPMDGKGAQDDTTLDNVAPSKGHVTYPSRNYGR